MALWYRAIGRNTCANEIIHTHYIWHRWYSLVYAYKPLHNMGPREIGPYILEKKEPFKHRVNFYLCTWYQLGSTLPKQYLCKCFSRALALAKHPFLLGFKKQLVKLSSV